MDFPASSKKTGKNLLKPSHKHYKDNNGVYETTDAHGNTVYWAHEGSLWRRAVWNPTRRPGIRRSNSTSLYSIV